MHRSEDGGAFIGCHRSHWRRWCFRAAFMRFASRFQDPLSNLLSAAGRYVLFFRTMSDRNSIVNNSVYLYRLFHSRTKSASWDSHMYVSGWLLCYHERKYLQDPLHHVLTWPDQDDTFRQDLIHCSGS